MPERRDPPRRPVAGKPSARATSTSARPTGKQAARREADKPRPAAQARRPGAAAKPDAGGPGRLRSELLVPLGLGALVIVGVLGLLALAGSKLGPTLVVIIIAAGAAMSAGLVVWIGWLTESGIVRPLARARDALQLMEEGNYDTRLEPEGARELHEL